MRIDCADSREAMLLPKDLSLIAREDTEADGQPPHGSFSPQVRNQRSADALTPKPRLENE
jgi:hypothetical protein